MILLFKRSRQKKGIIVETSGIASVGLFLLLAFVIPGVCYTFVLRLCFPEDIAAVIKSLSGPPKAEGSSESGEAFSISVIIGLFIVTGLLVTSVTFSCEILLRHLEFFQEWYPSIPFKEIAVAEASGKGTTYLQTVAGQPIMHLNVGLGLLLILVVYILALIFKCPCRQQHYLLLIISILGISFANLLDASVLSKQAVETISAAKQVSPPKSTEKTSESK
jgi:hypothetical protein